MRFTPLQTKVLTRLAHGGYLEVCLGLGYKGLASINQMPDFNGITVKTVTADSLQHRGMLEEARQIQGNYFFVRRFYKLSQKGREMLLDSNVPLPEDFHV